MTLTTRRNLALVVVAGLLGLVHLWLTVGSGLVLPSDPFWRLPHADTSQSVLGAEAFARDPAWHFPLASTSRLLGGGKPISIVYTDSAPWFAILLKALGLGVADVSCIGLVAILSVVLQPIAFLVLLLSLGVRRIESLIGGAILGSLLPAWYMRSIWHVALSSHWIIVLALAVAVHAVRNGVSGKVIAALTLLGAFSIGVHAYLFVMVAALAAGALLADVARSGMRAVPVAAAGLLVFAAAAAAVAGWALGYEQTGGSFGFGLFSMNALSPFVPQRSGLTRLLLGDARLFLDATGRQYEGFNYLGAGVLVVIGVGMLELIRRRPPLAGWRPAIPLVLALLGLTALALSNRVFAGQWLLLDIKLPDRLMALLVQIRSSGRLFWPVAYAALALSMLMLDRSGRRGMVGGVLAGAIVLQGIDTSVLRRVLAAEYGSRTEQAVFDASLWQRAPFAGQDLRMVPSYNCAVGDDHEVMRQAALAVERAGGTVEGGPTARFDPALCRPDVIEQAVAGAGGRWVDLLLAQSLAPPLLEQAKASGRCLAVERGLLCGPRPQG